MKLKIKITKDVLERSMYCGVKNSGKNIIENCAIAVAVRDIFPHAIVTGNCIYPFYKDYRISIYHHQNNFIANFDALRGEPLKRLNLTPFDFEIDLPDEAIEKININDIYQSETLELV